MNEKDRSKLTMTIRMNAFHWTQANKKNEKVFIRSKKLRLWEFCINFDFSNLYIQVIFSTPGQYSVDELFI